MEEKTYIKRLGILFIIALFSLAPFAYQKWNIGSEWRGVPTFYITDSLYYFIRMHEVVDGFPLGGNPYFLEHNSDRPPMFSIAETLAIAPVFLGFSFNTGFYIGMVVWNFIFLLLLFHIFKKIFPEHKLMPWIALGIVYAGTYGMMVRPVVMEVVLPFFALFWYALLVWLEEPERKRNIVFLTLAFAATFYIYPYAWQIAVATMFFAFVLIAFQGTRKQAMIVVGMFLVSLVLALPVLVHMIASLKDPLYLESISRIGFHSSHIPAGEAWNTGRWIILGMIGFIMARSSQKPFFFITGLGILAVLFSNVVTGKDFDLGNHAGRFAMFWMLVAFPALALNMRKRMVVLILIIGSVGITRQLARSINPPFNMDRLEENRRAQLYRAPIEWLDHREDSPKVVWANEMSNYVSILSKHYVLFPGQLNYLLYVLPKEEIQERYLLSRSFEESPDYKREFAFFAGVGPDAMANKNAIIQHMRDLNRTAVHPNINDLLAKYHVSYIIKDVASKTVRGVDEVYRDSNFVIYERK